MSVLTDIAAEIKALNPSARDLRKFGLLFLVVLGGLGLLMLWRASPWSPWFLGAGAIFGVLGMLWPAALKGIYFLWMTLGACLGVIVSNLILTILFFLIITPIGWVMRLLGKDLLDKKMKDRDSYWVPRDEGDYQPSRTEKMF